MNMKQCLACNCVFLVGVGALAHTCRKPDEGVEEMPNTISVSEPYVQQTNTAAHMIGSYLSTVR
jgi:hypothetical protein